jgi:rhamnosyltransferase
MGSPEKIGVIIPTRNAGPEFRRCLQPVRACCEVARCLVVDSGSTDGSAELAAELGCEVVAIAPQTFNHGSTREMARSLLDTPIIVFLTQDAILTDPDAILRLIAPIRSGAADIAYGRQLPKPGSDLFESLPRLFNYPEVSAIRRIGDVPEHGVFTFFCSNSFAAYRQASLDRVGGFPTVLTNEDYFVTAAILKQGGAIAYVAEAQAWHSHRYTLKQEYLRYYDAGVVRGERPWVQQLVGNAEGRGVRMSGALLSTLLRTRPWMVPYCFLHLLMKWVGFRVGMFAGSRRRV